MKQQVGTKLETFERKVVFRTARGYFLLLAVLALLAFVGGVVIGARGIVRPEPAQPVEPVLPEAPTPPPALTAADVERWIERQKTAPSAVVSQHEPGPMAAAARNSEKATDPRSEKIEALIAKLRSLFPEPQYSWKDSYRRECARPSPYGCLRYENKLEKEGVDGLIADALRPELDGDSADELIAVLEQLVAVLEAVPVDRRAEMIAPTVEAYRDAQAEYLERVRDRDREISDIRAEYEATLAEYEEELARVKAEKEEDLSSGMYGVLFGLGLIVLVSVFLAHFAIERHLRLLREVLTENRGGRP